jgi:hypothetical protein
MALHLTYLERINQLRKAGTPLIYLFEMWVNADMIKPDFIALPWMYLWRIKQMREANISCTCMRYG